MVFSKKISFDSVAMISQNSIYLLVFASICFIFYIKQIYIHMYCNPYFYTTYTFNGVNESILVEFNYEYIYSIF